MKKKRRQLILIIMGFCIVFHSCQQPSANNVGDEGKPSETGLNEGKKSESITLSDLKWLLKQTADKGDLETFMDEHSYNKRVQGIYISNEMITSKKPKHWLKCVEMGDLSSVTFSTVDANSWDQLVGELAQLATPEGFKESPSFQAKRYQFDNYIVETYLPIEGIDVSLNNLYDVLIRYKAEL